MDVSRLYAVECEVGCIDAGTCCNGGIDSNNGFKLIRCWNIIPASRDIGFKSIDSSVAICFNVCESFKIFSTGVSINFLTLLNRSMNK